MLFKKICFNCWSQKLSMIMKIDWFLLLSLPVIIESQQSCRLDSPTCMILICDHHNLCFCTWRLQETQHSKRASTDTTTILVWSMVPRQYFQLKSWDHSALQLSFRTITLASSHMHDGKVVEVDFQSVQPLYQYHGSKIFQFICWV